MSNSPAPPPLDPAAVMASIQAMSEQLTIVTAKMEGVERRAARQATGADRDSELLRIKRDELFDCTKWDVQAVQHPFQRKAVCDEMKKFICEKMKENGEWSRDYYEVDALLEILDELLIHAYHRAKEAGSRKLLSDDTSVLERMIIRCLLLKEKAENGVESMRFLDKRMREVGIPERLEAPLKELRQRQAQAALFRSGASGRAELHNQLPRGASATH